MRGTTWTEEHVNFLEALIREEALSTQEMATRMSKQFHMRVTPGHVNTLLRRMRTPSDRMFRNLPYRRQAKFMGHREL